MDTTGIANMALRRVGLAPIDNLDNETDQSEERGTCSDFFETCRDETLERAPWPFATRRLILTALTGTAWTSDATFAKGDKASFKGTIWRSLVDANTGYSPDLSPSQWMLVGDPRWGYVYQLPDDCITVRRVGLDVRSPGSDAVNYEERPDLDDESEPNARLLLTDYYDRGFAPVEYTMRATNPAMWQASFNSALAWRLAYELALSIRKDEQLGVRCWQAWEQAVGRASSNSLSGELSGPRALAEHQAARR